MSNGFVNWLTAELNERGWSNSELARRADMVPSTISMVISEHNGPSLEFCVKVARAFGLRDVDVLRVAGLIDPVAPEAEREGEVLRIYRSLPSPKREAARVMMRSLDALEFPASASRQGTDHDTAISTPEVDRRDLIRRLNRIVDVATEDQLRRLLERLLSPLENTYREEVRGENG